MDADGTERGTARSDGNVIWRECLRLIRIVVFLGIASVGGVDIGGRCISKLLSYDLIIIATTPQ